LCGRERARKGDPLPGLLAREKTTTSSSSSTSSKAAAAASLAEPMTLDHGYDDESEEGYDSADEAEKKTSSKQGLAKPGTVTAATSKRQYVFFLLCRPRLSRVSNPLCSLFTD
jgi:hypothetical protein